MGTGICGELGALLCESNVAPLFSVLRRMLRFLLDNIVKTHIAIYGRLCEICLTLLHCEHHPLSEIPGQARNEGVEAGMR